MIPSDKNIQQLIDERPMSTAQLLIVLFCFVLNMIDGMDVVVVSYVAPRIIQEWSVTSQTFGMVFSAALIGMATGAMFISPYTDIIGRRLMVLFSIILVSIGMLLTAFADTVAQLIVLRLFTGLGIGSMLASLTALVSEYSSNRRRNLAIGFVLGGYPVGATLTGLLAAWVIPEYGWRSMFIAGGLISTLLLPFVIFMLPESLEFLLKKQPKDALGRLNSMLLKMKIEQLDMLPVSEKSSSNSNVSDSTITTMFSNIMLLLTLDLRGSTLRLWTAFFMAFFTLYFLLSWIPKISEDTGLSVAQGAYAGAVFNFGSFFGIVTLGHISYALGLKRSICIFMLSSAILMIIFGIFRFTIEIYMLTLFVLGFFVQGGFVGLYSVAARLYPVQIRTTGVGWGIGLGRFGAIISPALGGFAIGLELPSLIIFSLFAIPFVICGYAVMSIRDGNVN